MYFKKNIDENSTLNITITDKTITFYDFSSADLGNQYIEELTIRVKDITLILKNNAKNSYIKIFTPLYCFDLTCGYDDEKMKNLVFGKIYQDLLKVFDEQKNEWWNE